MNAYFTLSIMSCLGILHAIKHQLRAVLAVLTRAGHNLSFTNEHLTHIR